MFWSASAPNNRWKLEGRKINKNKQNILKKNAIFVPNRFQTTICVIVLGRVQRRPEYAAIPCFDHCLERLTIPEPLILFLLESVHWLWKRDPLYPALYSFLFVQTSLAEIQYCLLLSLVSGNTESPWFRFILLVASWEPFSISEKANFV